MFCLFDNFLRYFFFNIKNLYLFFILIIHSINYFLLNLLIDNLNLMFVKSDT